MRMGATHSCVLLIELQLCTGEPFPARQMMKEAPSGLQSKQRLLCTICLMDFDASIFRSDIFACYVSHVDVGIKRFWCDGSLSTLELTFLF